MMDKTTKHKICRTIFPTSLSFTVVSFFSIGIIPPGEATIYYAMFALTLPITILAWEGLMKYNNT